MNVCFSPIIEITSKLCGLLKLHSPSRRCKKSLRKDKTAESFKLLVNLSSSHLHTYVFQYIECTTQKFLSTIVDSLTDFAEHSFSRYLSHFSYFILSDPSFVKYSFPSVCEKEYTTISSQGTFMYQFGNIIVIVYQTKLYIICFFISHVVIFAQFSSVIMQKLNSLRRGALFSAKNI